MKSKIVGLVIGLAGLVGLSVLLNKSTSADKEDLYECAFCTDRFTSSDDFTSLQQHMESHIQSKWGQTGTPGWILEDVNRDGIINVLDMIIIGQRKWTLEPIEEGVYKIVF